MAQYQYCPKCGAKLDTRPGAMRRLARGVGQWRASRQTTFDSSAIAPWEPPQAPQAHGQTMTAIRQTPVRGQNLEADLATPFLQAIATGLFVALLGLYLAWVREGFLWHQGLIAGVVAAGLYWALALIWNRKLLWLVEEVIQQDITGDGEIGQPAPPPPTTLEVIHKSEDNQVKRMLRFDLPDGLTEADIADLARGVLVEHRGLSESAWTGKGKPFSKPKFKALLDTLTAAGLVRWVDDNNHAQGRELTGQGRRALYSLAYGARTHAHADNGDTISGRYEIIGEG